MRRIALPLVILFCLPILAAITKEKVVQIDVTSILNARPVTTFANGKLITWSKGIDGNGSGDGYLTKRAALVNGDKTPHALPDKPIFAANASHPEIILNYYNNDTVSNQARYVSGEGEFEFEVPEDRYTGMYLCLTSSEGPSQLEFELAYADGMETQSFKLPDYYDDLKPNDPNIMYVAHDLAKWDDKNKMREADHHNIDAVSIHPDAQRVLKAIKVKKSKGGYLVFWGATGVTAGYNSKAKP